MSRFQQFSAAELNALRHGGRILRDCITMLKGEVRPGISTGELDRLAETFIRDRGAEPAFQGYHGYPATFCLSVNDQCVHAIPGDRFLEEGDIISLDGGVRYQGLITDACDTVGVGQIDPEAARLIASGEKALKAAIKLARSGLRIGDLSAVIQQSVEGDGFTIVRALTGHGLGTSIHQFPDVPNFGKPGSGPVIPDGAVIAIEPIVSAGGSAIREDADGWTISTVDGSLSTHSEHTVLITEKGCEILA